MNPKYKTAKAKILSYAGPNRVIVHHGSKDVPVRLAVNEAHLPVGDEIEFDPKAIIVVETEVPTRSASTGHKHEK